MDPVSTPDFAWFALKPSSPGGLRTVASNIKQDERWTAFGDTTTELVFSAKRLSISGGGHLASFGGSNAIVDVFIPRQPNTYMGSFSTTATGDLLLCDGGKGDIKLFATEIDGHEHLDGFGISEPGQQCVIPMTDGLLFSVVVAGTGFDFEWRIPLDSRSIENHRKRVHSFYPSRWSKSKSPLPMPQPVEYFATGGCVSVIPYKSIAFDGVVQVYASIDLRTGEKLAVKEIDLGKIACKVEATRPEIDMWASLQHKHVAKLVHHQNWSGLEGCPVQFLMTLYDGDARKLVHRSAIDKPFSTNRIPALPNFLMHCLAALSHLHKQRIVHGNVKLRNILYSREQGQSVPAFYLAGFGATATKVGLYIPISERHYVAKENHNSDARPFSTQASADIYSFGIAILEFLGVITLDQLIQPAANWRQKLLVNDYKEFFSQPAVQDYHSFTNLSYRIQSLRVHGLLKNSVLEAMLDPNPTERPTAAEALEAFSEHYDFEIPADLDY